MSVWDRIGLTLKRVGRLCNSIMFTFSSGPKRSKPCRGLGWGWRRLWVGFVQVRLKLGQVVLMLGFVGFGAFWVDFTMV